MAVNTGDVYVSIIPFVKDVNVGSSYSGASWIDWTDGKPTTEPAAAAMRPPRAAAQQRLHLDAGFAQHLERLHHRSRQFERTEPANYDENVNPPVAGVNASLFPAEQYGSCPLQMKGLSYNWTAMNTMVNQMTPNGNTNQAIGLVWGWMSLVGGGPLTAPAMDSNYQYQQIIILLTDGLNTQDRWYSNAVPDRYAPAGPPAPTSRRAEHHDLCRPGRHRRRPDLDTAAELRERTPANSSC